MNRRALFFAVFLVCAVGLVASNWLANRMQDITEGVEALPPRSFEALTAVFVGTGGSHENHRRRGPAVAVGVGTDVVLLDAGRGVAEGLRSARIPGSQPRAVYLTSLLPENTVGLDDLLLTGWLAPRDEPLRVVGPPGTAALVDGILAAHRRGIEGEGEAFGLPAAGATITAVELGAEATYQEGELVVRGVPLPGGPVPAAAWRIEAAGRSIVGGGAAWGADALVELARDVSLLVHEGFFAESVELAIEAGAANPERLRRESSWRTPIPEAADRAARAEARNLAFVRLRPPPLFAFQVSRAAGDGYRGTIFVPADGDEITP